MGKIKTKVCPPEILAKFEEALKNLTPDKVQMAPVDVVDMYKEEVDIVLRAIGHPRAWISDMSDVGDFFCEGMDAEEKAAIKQLKTLSGMKKITAGTELWEIAKAIAVKNGKKQAGH